jgi:predicted nucleic acid-binding protein
VTIHLDTSVLIHVFTATRPLLDELTAFVEGGERLTFSTVVLYEWLRGPRTRGELALQEEVFPRQEAVAFGVAEADAAARLYARVKKPRGREIELAIAACALVHGASLWTVNREDFADIPDLRLI